MPSIARLFITACCLCSTTILPALAQPAANLPTDYLTPAFHAQRRQALRDLMPANSVTVVFAYPERVFSNDVNYVYHANPDLYYFSGYKEPDALLLIFKELQGTGDSSYNEVLFVRKRDALQEQWTGRRLGVEGAKTQLGFKKVHNDDVFANFNIDFKKFSTILYDQLPDATGSTEPGSLASLIGTFKEKTGVKEIDKQLSSDLILISLRATPENLPRVINYIKPRLESAAYKNNTIIQQLLAKPDAATLTDAKAKIKALLGGMGLYDDLTNELRGVKTPEELALLGKSIELSSIAHTEVMRAVKPDMAERELEGILLYVHKKYGAEDEGYAPIIGAGANGCILHYEENSATRLDNQLVLLDVGAEYHGYSADVTRTIPANGKFSEEQKAIYQLVYDAQEEVFKLCKAGVPFDDLQKKTTKVLTAGLLKLNIIKDAADVTRYYPHGVSHHLGLDVHDKGERGPLKENMVITVEPGIYIPPGSPCDKKWWNIGVRIEDDVVIGKDQCTNLSAMAPRSWQDIEKVAAEKSIFDAVKLPPLK